MAITHEASTQYGDMSGTVALDDADFEGLGAILGIDDRWHVVGVSIFLAHPSLGIQGKSQADLSYTHLTAWAIDGASLVPSEGLAGLFKGDSDVPVEEFTFGTADNVYPSTADAICILLRSAKRLNIVLWDRALPPSASAKMNVKNTHSMVWQESGWIEELSE